MEFAGEKFVEKFDDLVHNSLNENGFDLIYTTRLKRRTAHLMSR